MSSFNPLDPNQTAQEGSFAAKLAARKAAKEGKDLNDETVVDVSSLTNEERTQLVKNNRIQQAAKDFSFAPPNQAQEALVIIFDDSGSMGGQKILDAHEGITEFMRECVPNETAIKIAPLNARALDYTCNLPKLALDVVSIRATGGTPLYSVTQANMELTGDIKPKRMILFSDGEPNGSGDWERDENWQSTGVFKHSDAHNMTVKLAQERGIVLDTCYIADAGYSETSKEYQVMKDLAERTGGIFIVFEKGKCSFKHGFKYLTKGNRMLLMDGSFKAALEQGRI